MDANKLSSTFGSPISEDAKPLLRWLLKGDGVLVYNDELAAEIRKVAIALKTLLELKKTGRAKHIVSKPLSATQQRITRSNDQHILSLAIASGARILHSGDVALMDDFTNAKIIGNPRGKVYQTKRHTNLLKHVAACTPKSSISSTTANLKKTKHSKRPKKRKLSV